MGYGGIRMRKKIKKWGNSAGILFSRGDLELYDLEIGDIVDIEDIVKVRRRKNK